MKPLYLFCSLAVLLLALSTTSFAQVDAIKRASKSGSSGSSSGGSSSGEGGNISANGCANGIWLTAQLGRGMVGWQGHQLQRRTDIPSVVSLEVMGQVALQPPANYLLLPRIRGNWGLFSTDFRYNFLIEDAGIDNQVKSLGTFDWQVLQMNFVNSKHVTVRLGGGLMAENFGDHNGFFEWTFGTDLRFKENKWGGGAEYRATDVSDVGVMPRREVNARMEHRLLEWKRLKGYATVGGVFQRYYNAVSVWGVQTGLIFRLQ